MHAQRKTPRFAAGRQAVDKVCSINNSAVILRNEVTKDLINCSGDEVFEILRLRFAPLRMTEARFADKRKRPADMICSLYERQ